MTKKEHTQLVHDLLLAYTDKNHAHCLGNSDFEKSMEQEIDGILRQLFVLNTDGDTSPAVVFSEGLRQDDVDVDVFSIPINTKGLKSGTYSADDEYTARENANVNADYQANERKDS